MEAWLRTAARAAEAAAGIHQRWAARIGEARIEEKGAGDYVSEVDREAQEAVLAIIRERHPGHRILAEEEGGTDPGHSPSDPLGDAGSTPVWVIDPLDGTANFLHRHPMYAVSIGIAVEGRAVVGYVAQPATGERWWAREGAGAWRNGKEIRVSTDRRLGRALVGTGFPFKVRDRIPEYLGQLERVLGASSGVRRAGSAALDFCYLAQGTLDAFWELLLNPWDVAAGLAILREAGGVASRLERGTVELAAGGWIAANSVSLQDDLLRVVTGSGRA